MQALRDFIEKHRGKAVLLEHELKSLLREMGLPVPKGVYIGKDGTLPLLELTYPLVAKVSSTKIASKSDVGGVRLGIKGEDELRRAVRELLEIKNAEGVLIEEEARHQVKEGVEVIVGGIIDRQFGPVIMFGIGGVFVELFRDVAFALAPLKREDAHWLIRQVKGHRLLEGYRGLPPLDINALADIMTAVSGVMATGLFTEIDLNPVAVYPEGALILDAKGTAPL